GEVDAVGVHEVVPELLERVRAHGRVGEIAEQQRDPVRAPLRVVGRSARHHDDVLRVLDERDVDLLAVDDVTVAPADGVRLDRRDVRPRLGLGERTGPHISRDKPRQVSLLLLSGAVAGEQTAAEHRSTEEERAAFHPAAALLRHGDPEHPVLGERVPELSREAVLLVDPLPVLVLRALRELEPELAQGELVVVVVEVHGRSWRISASIAGQLARDTGTSPSSPSGTSVPGCGSPSIRVMTSGPSGVRTPPPQPPSPPVPASSTPASTGSRRHSVPPQSGQSSRRGNTARPQASHTNTRRLTGAPTRRHWRRLRSGTA